MREGMTGESEHSRSKAGLERLRKGEETSMRDWEIETCVLGLARVVAQTRRFVQQLCSSFLAGGLVLTL